MQSLVSTRRIAASWVLVLVTGAIVLGAGSSAEAQGDEALTAKQIEYYKKGLEAYKDEDFDRAIEYYELALAEGEWNILHLGIGRALSRKGRCAAADARFVKALEARAVPSPPAAAIKAKIDEYRIDLRLQCDGTLVVECKPADLEIRVGSSARRPCSAFPIEVPPGDLTLTAYAYDVSEEKTIRVKGLEETRVSFSIDKPKGWKEGQVSTPPEDKKPPAVEKGSGLALYGYIVGGVGVAVLGGALVTDVVLLGDKIDELESAASTRASNEQTLFDEASGLQSLSLGLYVGGAVLSAAGVALILWPSETESAPEAKSAGLAPWLSPTSAGLRWTSPF